MEDPVATSQILDSEFNSVYLHLLWFLAAPVVYFVAAWLHRRINSIEEPTWIERLLGAAGDESPGFLSILSIDNGPSLAPAALKATDPPEPKEQLKPSRIFELFRQYPAPWAVTGGWAIDLFLGEITRKHESVAVAVLRRDQAELFDYLIGWQPKLIDPRGAAEPRPWLDAAPIGAPVEELQTMPLTADIRSLTVLLIDTDGDEWYSSQHPQVRLPLALAIQTSKGGIPYLAPQIVLLRKAGRMTEIDEQDFDAALPALSEMQRKWLRLALETTLPGHAWIARLG